MIHVSITFNKERTTSLYRDYFHYERKKLFRQMPTAIMLLLASGFILTGIFLSVDFFVYMGLATFIIVIAAVLFYYLKFKTGFVRFMKDLESYAEENKGTHVFEFNNEKMVYRSEKFKNEIKWEAIRSFERNNGAIYLFQEKNRLFDIFSPEIMGKENFAIFEKLVSEKIR